MPTGTIGFNLKPVAANLSGWTSISGTVPFVLPKIAPSGSGWTTISGSTAFNLKAIAASLAGWTTITGTSAIDLKPLVLALTGQIGVIGTAGVTIKPVIVSESGWISISGPVAVALKAIAASAAGKIGVQGTSAVVLKKLVLSLVAKFTDQSSGITGEPELAPSVNVRTGTSYTVLHEDRERLIVFTSDAAVAVTLPRAIGAFGNGFRFQMLNLGGGVVTVTPSTSLINQASDPITLVTADNVEFWSDGVDWWAIESNYS